MLREKWRRVLELRALGAGAVGAVGLELVL